MSALRKAELCGEAWSEIDFEKSEMLIPTGRMKTKKVHLVMLPTQAIKMLRELQRLGGSPWILPMPTNPDRAMHSNNIDATHDAALVAGDIIDYNIHDHRHTASTHLREQGHFPEVVETALSQAIAGMAVTYSHAQCEAGTDADKLLNALAVKPLSQTEVSKVFSGNKKRTELVTLLTELQTANKIKQTKEAGSKKFMWSII